MNLAKVYATTGDLVIGAANEQTVGDAVRFAFGESAKIKPDWTVVVDGVEVGKVEWEKTGR